MKMFLTNIAKTHFSSVTLNLLNFPHFGCYYTKFATWLFVSRLHAKMVIGAKNKILISIKKTQRKKEK